MTVETPTLNRHSAAGSMAGYLFQPERALLLLCKLPRGARLGIEIGEDITVEEAKATTFEQLKHTVGTAPTLSDASPNFWKSLAMWIEAVESAELDNVNAYFSIVTNGEVQGSIVTRFLTELDDRQVQDVYSQIFQFQPNDTVAPYHAKVKTASEASVRRVINRLLVVKGAGVLTDDSTMESLASALHLAPGIPINAVLHGLLGWVVAQSLTKFRAKEPAWINVDDFNEQVRQLIVQASEISFVVRYQHLVEPPDPTDIRRHLNSKFISQLQKIMEEVDEEFYLEAIKDFLNTETERSRLSAAGKLIAGDLVGFDDELKSIWRDQFQNGIRRSGYTSQEECGRAIYFACADSNPMLRRLPVERYFVKGSYHSLSDKLEVGWHPNYRQLIT